ncbi:histidine--tRNA ligase [Psychroflexus sp. ALD_RP9]|uniref:histidine--tRNA ligase n=1 Tax=Psychroflexus sp. ALD_RP9 TaxID=2777186 RepID=UPI001A8D1E06|nr:histidine--tRNA ligase [Psychroflexus sp. ALD_RP9]QSS97331.1 histidine--tRNA ligase [Psychroflexus sp. ALD_RP9]
MAQKPSIPKGTRDFSSVEVAKREYIINTIKTNFKRFGFQPIETPSFEKSSTLLGKYGEEGDRLIFKILNSGDYLKKANDEDLSNKDSAKVSSSIAQKALKYDLTVPFARYVVQHQHGLVFPFKRYQIQPVWRADRPQKGRFREFVQCDADVIGSDSLWQEVDFIQLYDQVFKGLKLDGVTIKMNNRKILSGFAEVIGEQDKLIDFTVALDKLDKIGEQGVKDEMLEKGISTEALQKIQPIFSLSGDFNEKIKQLKSILSSSEIGLKGIEELEFLNNALSDYQFKSSTLDLDVTLARGLNYYTGAIFEVAAPNQVKLGSIGGGGRYDDLTGIFGLKNMSGVGISFGLDRIYLVLEELNLFPETLKTSTDLLCLNFGFEESKYMMRAINRLRLAGVNVELYPDQAKFKKQMQYAEKRHINHVLIAGESEMAEDKFSLKNLATGDQNNLTLDELLNIFKP